MRYKLYSFLIISIFTLVGLSACYDNNNASNKSDTKVVKIGSILPLTGPIAAYGNYAKDGQLKAIDDLNKMQEKIKFELVLEDGKSQGKEAITAYQKLRSDGVDIITAGSSVMAMPILPLAIKDKVLYFPSASHPEINKEVSPLVFRHFVTAAQEAPLILSDINETNKGKTVLINVNDEFGNGFAQKVNEIKDQYKNISIVLETTAEKTETDFTAIVQKIKQANPDNVIIISYGKSAGSLVNKIKEQNINADIYVAFSYLLTEADKVAQSNAGIKAVIMDAEKIDIKEASDYGTVFLIGKSIIETNKTDIESIAKHIEEIGKFNANGIEMTYQTNHDILPTVKLVTLK